MSDFKGQTDFDPSWMNAVDLDRYGDLLGESVQMASNISHTEGANWDPFSLSTEYNIRSRGPLPPQVDSYIYQVRRQTAVTSGNMPEFSGVYIPDVEASCPQFLVSYRPAPLANVFLRYDDLLHPETGEKYGEEKITGRRKCTWTLVEPQDASGVQNSADFPEHAGPRVEGGSVCPISGFYVTPARIGSRAYFKAGTVMPSFSAEFGLVIWQWDVDQG